VNRDHGLFLVVGLMMGFILGYVAFEAMATRQPERRPANEQAMTSDGTAAAGVSRTGGGGRGGANGGAPALATGGPAMGGMEQVQRLRRYVEENPEDSSALRLLANMNYDIQNWSRAAELYERLLQLEPGDHDVMTDLGITYRNLVRPAEALEQFRQVHAEDPNNWHSRYNELLVLAFDLKDFAAAMVVLEELEALQPDNPEVEKLVAEVRRLQGA